MAKIFIYTFSLLATIGIFPDSISKKDLGILRRSSIDLYENKKYTEAIPVLEKYLSFREEVRFKIYLAKAILFREDLPEPREEDEIFLRQEKILAIIKNYNRAAMIFSEVTPYLERVTPKDKSIADLYFLWGLSEQFSQNKEKAISLFKKSAILNEELKSMANYNIAALYEDLGQKKDSEIYFNKLK
jgi:tetratricopeptide (TPR) repeat protein